MDEQNNNGVPYGIGNDSIGGVDYSNGNIGGTTVAANASLPQEVTVWSKIKSFLLQDVNRDIVVTMTPHQAKVLKEVHDFWFQEINFGKVKDFLFQDITLGTSKK